jgi:16S rRNA processing protein RimM
MIRKSEVYPIGKLFKPHGLSGEIVFAFRDDVFDRTNSPYWVLEMNGILVPFFVESYRFRSDETALVRLEGIENESQAKELSNKEVYYPVKYADDEKEDVDDLNSYVGFKVFEKSVGYLGEIEDIDDSTFNVLFKISDGKNEVLMPVAEEFVIGIDMDKREIQVDLPEGLLNL